MATITWLRISVLILLLVKTSNGFTQTCTNWLNVPNQPSFVRVGDLDISGDKITVEATFNRTSPWNGADVFQGDLVSKHEDVNDCNYVLRPGSAEITTSNGYFKTPTICNIQLNKTYHAAFVYDGSVLKFYRNGFLMSQIPASGPLVQNNWQTQIGLYFNQRTVENFIGYINEVKIWNVARTQTEIREYMDRSLPSPQTTPGLLAYYTFDNLLNKQGNANWNGTLFGNATIGRTNPNCTFVADSCASSIVCPPSVRPDFSFEQSVCNPKALVFSTNLDGAQSLVNWDFGNGQTNNSSTTATSSYSDFGNYSVKLKISNSPGCLDSVVKQLNIDLSQGRLLSNNDTTVCTGDTVVLKPFTPSLAFCWESDRGVLNTTDTSYISTLLNTAYFIYTSKQLGINLAENGSFEEGNIGFVSGYPFSSSGIQQGVYTVGTNPTVWNAALAPCRDHTTRTGNMLLVNGALQGNTVVWEQTVAVSQNTNYSFGTWLQTISSGNAAHLQFVINGKRIGNKFSTEGQSCTWKQYFTTWNSGSSGTATIAIINTDQSPSGHDLALDDIFFGEVSIKQDTVVVSVTPKPNVDLGNDLKTCSGDVIQLNGAVTGASIISWKPSLYLNNSNIANPIATPLSDITYVAEVRSGFGCIDRDTLQIRVVTKPQIDTRADTSVCQATPIELTTVSSNATGFNWEPATTLSDASQQSPVARPIATTRYKITAFNDGCSSVDSVLITVNEMPSVTVSNDTLVCENATLTLLASGGSQYSWSPALSLSATNVPNPIARPLVSTTYRVEVQNSNGCVKTDSIRVEVKLKPIFSIQPPVQSICLGDTASITASGGDRYLWFPVDSVLVRTPHIAMATPRSSTQYKVHITDQICNISELLTATVKVNPLPPISITKSNDIDCSNAEAQLNVFGGTNYEWSPMSGLSNSFIANPRASPVETTTYRVTVTSAEGCRSKDSVTVNVSSNGVNGFYIPNAFTPNRDGKNDCFTIKNWGPIENFEIKIFNRWGEMVFASDSPSFCWDGIFKGLEQPSGVFVYYVRTKAKCGNVFKKGTIALLR